MKEIILQHLEKHHNATLEHYGTIVHTDDTNRVIIYTEDDRVAIQDCVSFPLKYIQYANPNMFDEIDKRIKAIRQYQDTHETEAKANWHHIRTIASIIAQQIGHNANLKKIRPAGLPIPRIKPK